MRLLQTQNACKRGAKCVYCKHKTRLLATINVFAGNAFCETNRGPGVVHSRDIHVLEFCARHILLGTRCDRSYIVDMTQGRGLNRRQVELTYQRANLTLVVLAIAKVIRTYVRTFTRLNCCIASACKPPVRAR